MRVSQSVAYVRVIIARSLGLSLVSRYAIVYLRYKSTPSQPSQPPFLSISSFKRARICCVYGYRIIPFFFCGFHSTVHNTLQKKEIILLASNKEVIMKYCRVMTNQAKPKIHHPEIKRFFQPPSGPAGSHSVCLATRGRLAPSGSKMSSYIVSVATTY